MLFSFIGVFYQLQKVLHFVLERKLSDEYGLRSIRGFTEGRNIQGLLVRPRDISQIAVPQRFVGRIRQEIANAIDPEGIEVVTRE